MYSSGILLLVCGVPAAFVVALLLATGVFVELPMSHALVAGATLITSVACIGAFFLGAAGWITKRQSYAKSA